MSGKGRERKLIERVREKETGRKRARVKRGTYSEVRREKESKMKPTDLCLAVVIRPARPWLFTCAEVTAGGRPVLGRPPPLTEWKKLGNQGGVTKRGCGRDFVFFYFYFCLFLSPEETEARCPRGFAGDVRFAFPMCVFALRVSFRVPVCIWFAFRLRYAFHIPVSVSVRVLRPGTPSAFRYVFGRASKAYESVPLICSAKGRAELLWKRFFIIIILLFRTGRLGLLVVCLFVAGETKKKGGGVPKHRGIR